ncbi:transketolase family protein [Microbacterium sp. W1N]|uniref:transketolase family protein n=1 Tax=Microbacterium festucae TaxID=2977531 RepID=UPI0021BE450C|nr:transketolase C-terminal domain-containing protein [Microbacterium festucae]MCT9821381.1 transketolase family protein [Microbacterium festucae]
MNTTSAPKLKTSAMIASFADPGQKTAPAPFGHALRELAETDERIVGLSADLAKYTDMHIFRDAHPDRFFQMGMAEQLLFGAAAGLAEVGLVPFASTYSVFAARRAYDFICLDIAEPGLNVNIVGGLPGLTTGYGPSHQATEDIAIFRGMPNLTIVDPCDSVDITQAVPQLAASAGPTYLRLLRGQVPTVLDEYDYAFELGKAQLIRPGNDVVFISSGLMTMRALQAADRLAAHKVDVAVVHSPTIKPFDADTVLRELDSPRVAFTLENHSVIGGLHEAVASAVVRSQKPRRVERIGLPDAFLDAGALPTLHARYGLGTDEIVQRVLAAIGSRPTGGRRYGVTMLNEGSR